MNVNFFITTRHNQGRQLEVNFSPRSSRHYSKLFSYYHTSIKKIHCNSTLCLQWTLTNSNFYYSNLSIIRTYSQTPSRRNSHKLLSIIPISLLFEQIRFPVRVRISESQLQLKWSFRFKILIFRNISSVIFWMDEIPGYFSTRDDFWSIFSIWKGIPSGL